MRYIIRTQQNEGAQRCCDLVDGRAAYLCRCQFNTRPSPG